MILLVVAYDDHQNRNELSLIETLMEKQIQSHSILSGSGRIIQ